MSNDELIEYMVKHLGDIEKELRGFIAIPSVSDDKEQVDRALDYALDLGTRLGFESRAVCNHQVGLIEIGEGPETVGILAHVDVVPPGEREGWNSEPFVMTRRKGRLYGRGTLDDKGPIVVCLYAMKALLDSGEPMHKKIQMILGTQEEVDWVDMNEYVKKYPLPDYGFTPDGEFPLCNIEKGIIDCNMIFRLDEKRPVDGWYLTKVDAGVMDNAIPGKAKAMVEKFAQGTSTWSREIVTTGKAVHSCQPEKGDNALFHLADTLEKEGLCENRLYDIMIMLRDKFADVYGKALGLYSDGETYKGEFVHRNAFSVTRTRIKGNQLSAHINVRFAYGTKADEILSVLEELAAEYDGNIEDICTLPAVFVSAARPFIKEFGDAYEEGTGRKHECVLAYGGSYAKAMPNIVSWGPIFPGDEDTCHEDNEYWSEASLLGNAKVFVLALYKVVMSDRSFK